MNWGAIKDIYIAVLKLGQKIEYCGNDEYKLIKYKSGLKEWEYRYRNGLPHGKNIWWHENGQIRWEGEWTNGKRTK